MKKFIALLLACILVVGGVGGGIYWKSKNSGKPVNVYSAQDLSTTYWGDENQTYGMVSTDHTQSVYLSDTQTVEKVMVEVGQTVKKGDVLMTYDTTLSQVELEKKDLEIKKMELELQKAQDKLAKIKTYRPGKKIPEKNLVDNSAGPIGTAVLTAMNWLPFRSLFLTGDVTPGGEEPPQSGEITEPGEGEGGSGEGGESSDPGKDPGQESGENPEEGEKDPEKDPSKPTEPKPTEPASSEDPGEDQPGDEPEEPEPEVVAPEEITNWLANLGTESSPYIYNWNDKYTFDQSRLEYLAHGRNDAWVILKVNPKKGEKPQEPENPFGSWWKMVIHKTLNGYTFEILEMCVNGEKCDLSYEEKENPGEDDPGFDPWDPGYGSSGITYTAAEIAQMLAEATEDVRDLDLELRIAKVEYDKMEKELNGGAVEAEIDGVITQVRAESEAKLEGTPVIDVSGGGGYYVKGSFSELKMDEIQVGMEVTVMSWESYQSYVGVVKEIGEYPVSDNYYQGDGNTNASTYSFTVFIDESANLREFEYVSLTYSGAVTNTNSFYLDNSMIRTENGKSYVYVKTGDGFLEKRFIRTGKGLWGSYTEILGGLSQSDEIAFPYGPDVKDGAPAVSASTDQLYASY